MTRVLGESRFRKFRWVGVGDYVCKAVSNEMHLLGGSTQRIRWPPYSGKKKAHKHKLSCPVKTRTNPGILLILHSGSPISPGLSLGQTRFVPGTIPGMKGGTESLCEKSLCAFFAGRHTRLTTIGRLCGGMDWWRTQWPPSQGPSIFRGSQTCRRAPDIPQRAIFTKLQEGDRPPPPYFPKFSLTKIRTVWVSIKFLSAKFGLTPPQKGLK